MATRKSTSGSPGRVDWGKRQLERLVAGQPVTTVALDLGYRSVSAFITSFRQRFGVPPRQWLDRGRFAG